MRALTLWIWIVVLLLVVLLGVRAGGHRGPVSVAAESNRPTMPVASVPSSAAAFDIAGDPGLVRFVREQERSIRYPKEDDGEAIEHWRNQMITRLRLLFDYKPVGTVVDHAVHESEVLGSVRRKLISYRVSDGTTIPAYVCEPIMSGKDRLGVLVIAGHGQGIRGTVGLVDDYQHGAAMALAVAGFVTITPELRGFGMLGSDIDLDHRAVAYNALAAGRFYKAVIAADLQRAIDILQFWPGVNPSKLAVTGASFGGEMAATMAVLDDRLDCVAVSASGLYCGPVPPATGGRADPRPHGCHLIPGGNALVHLEDWYRLIAPRPLLVVHGLRDVPPTAELFRKRVEHTYRHLGAEDRLTITIVDGFHEFHVRPTIDFLQSFDYER